MARDPPLESDSHVAELLQQKEWGDDGNELCELCQEYHDDKKDWIACSGEMCPREWVCRKASTLDDDAFNAECARGDDDDSLARRERSRRRTRRPC